jgi:hypothetical protein
MEDFCKLRARDTYDTQYCVESSFSLNTQLRIGGWAEVPSSTLTQISLCIGIPNMARAPIAYTNLK